MSLLHLPERSGPQISHTLGNALVRIGRYIIITDEIGSHININHHLVCSGDSNPAWSDLLHFTARRAYPCPCSKTHLSFQAFLRRCDSPHNKISALDGAFRILRSGQPGLKRDSILFRSRQTQYYDIIRQ